MSPRVISFEETFCVGDQSLRTTAKLQLTDDVRATCFTIYPGHAAGVELEGASWSVAHHSATKDTWLRYRRTLSSGAKLALTQHIPSNKWFLAPNLDVKITNGPVAGRDVRVETSYDFLNRAGSCVGTAYSGEDRQFKLALAATTNKGLVAAARAKLQRGVLHSVAASAGTQTPAVFSLKSRFPDGTKAKTSFQPGANILRVVAKHRAAPGKGDGPVATATLNVTAPLPLGKAAADPRILLGIKWTL